MLLMICYFVFLECNLFKISCFNIKLGISIFWFKLARSLIYWLNYQDSTVLCILFLSCFIALFLVGLQHLKQLNINSCRYVTDMNKLLPVKETLEQLDIGNCGGISDITPLHELT